MPNIIRGHIKYPAKQAAPKVEPKRDTSIFASPPWSAEEDAYVIKCYPKDGARIVGSVLGRTWRATQTRASHLGVNGPKILLRASA